MAGASIRNGDQHKDLAAPPITPTNLDRQVQISRIGVAGWSIASSVVSDFDAVGSHLERYARRFNAVEINSCFHRPHRASTYARWAANVGPDFRFAVKTPKTITHERRLRDCSDPIAAFAEQVAGVGDKRGPALVQLPPPGQGCHGAGSGWLA